MSYSKASLAYTSTTMTSTASTESDDWPLSDGYSSDSSEDCD